jgi:hypothetical protein
LRSFSSTFGLSGLAFTASNAALDGRRRAGSLEVAVNLAGAKNVELVAVFAWFTLCGGSSDHTCQLTGSVCDCQAVYLKTVASKSASPF